MSRKLTTSVTVWLRPVHHYKVRSVDNIAAVREREREGEEERERGREREREGEREREWCLACKLYVDTEYYFMYPTV